MNKSMVVAALVVLFAAVSASAQSDYIGLFSDEAYTSCSNSDASPGTLTVYVVHKEIAAGSRASRFQVRTGGGFTGTWIREEISPYVFQPDPLTIGRSVDGISVAYIFCLPSPIRILTLTYWCVGTSRNCSYLEVVPDPAASGTIEAVTCDFRLLPTRGSRMYINTDGSCGCGMVDHTPTKNSTWGAIKSLYD